MKNLISFSYIKLLCVYCNRSCYLISIEMLVLGVGAEIKQAPESIKAFLRSKAISLEIQDTVRKLRI